MSRLDRAREIVETARLSHPGAVELATFVSLAVRAESELVRAMRLEVLPRLSAAAEADLWFGPLIRLRGPDGIALHLDVLEILRGDLKERWLAGEERQLVERAWRVTQRVHQDTSPALVLEERVTWFALTGAFRSAEAELDRAVKELATGARPGITGWYAQAWGRLPAEVRATRAGWLLYQASGRPGPVRIRPAAVPDDLLSYDLALALAGVDDVRLGVRRDGDLIEFGDVDSAGAAAMLVPDTDPRIVGLRWPDEPARSAETIAVPSGQTIRREVGNGRLQLRTARGTLYELATQRVRRYLIAVGVAHYTWRSPLPGIPRGIRDLATRFEQFGYELALRELNNDPTGDQFLGRLGTWLADPSRQASDVVILYWSGHSAVVDGHHYLFMSDSDDADAEIPGQSLAVIAAARLGRMLATRIPSRLLVILDTSYAAQGVQELADASGGRELWAIASAGAAEEAYDEAFVDAFLHALDDEIAPSVQQYLALNSLVESASRRLAAVRPEQHAFLQRQAPAGSPPFFPNPRYSPQAAGDIDPSAADLAQHFLPRARGVAAASEPGWYFTGRTAALRDLVNFLSAGNPRTLEVTGDPGSGKSAVLGRLVVLADRDFRRTVPSSDIPPDTIPSEGSVDAAIYAAGKTLPDIVTALAAAADVSDRPDAQALFSAIARRPAPFVIVLDALDEAADPIEIAQHLLRPLADMPNVRLIVGARRLYLHYIDPSAIVIDLDSPRYLSPADLSDYARRILLAGDDRSEPTPYAGHPELATAVANAVAEAASPSFLVARLTAQTLAAQPAVVDPSAPARRATQPGTGGALFDFDLAAHLGREEQQRARDVLTPLAYAEGAGLPWEDIWARVAAALAQRSVTNDDIVLLRRTAGDYVVEAVEAGRSVYRLSRPELAEYLRQGQDEATAQRRITQVLLGMVPRLPGSGRDWSIAAPYILNHLAAHAAAAGMLTELLEDPGYVAAANPVTLRAALERRPATATATSPATGRRDDGAMIVAVHGLGQQATGQYVLYAEWLPAMQGGLRAAGYQAGYQLVVSEHLAMAYYGDLFRSAGQSGPAAPGEDVQSGLDENLFISLEQAAPASEVSPQQDAGSATGRTPLVQRAVRSLLNSRFFAGIAERTLTGDLRQLTRYLQEPYLRQAARMRVAELIGPSTRVVIAHDLGSLVAYEALCAHPEWNVKMFITLGSPLGLRNIVFDRLEPAPRNGIGSWPGSVERWVNITDQDDGIALIKELRPLFAGPVDDVLVDNGARAHSAVSYLAAPATGRAIADGLL